ncbi:hypothetical protein LINPERHAP1_LOCUS9714 [Linum perenne]
MVCFRSCFTAFKSRNRRQYLSSAVSSSSPPSNHSFVSLANSNSAGYGHGGVLEQIPEEPISHVLSESKEKEQSSCNVVKKVSFDCKVKTQEEDETLSSAEQVGKAEEKLNADLQTSCSNQEVEDGGVAITADAAADVGSDEDSEGRLGTVVEESSDSLFSISIGCSRKHQADMGEKEVNSPLPKCVPSDDSKNVSALNTLEETQFKEAASDNSKNVSTLNPLEEETRFKEATNERTTAATALRLQQYQDKENVELDINIVRCSSPEFSFKPLMDNSEEKGSSPKKLAEQDVAVDASLSNWLVVSGVKPQLENSNESVGNSTERQKDRPVLGALTIGVLKQAPANRTSPSKSRRQRRISGTPAMGTVGSYWRQTDAD